MANTRIQEDLLIRYNSSYRDGLTSIEISQRRKKGGENGGFNTVHPPLQCPKWVCCLLPCIKYIPSMKKFRLVQPDDAEVLRDGKWIRYDHVSLVLGDVIRLVEGDIVPADCVVLSLGMDHVNDIEVGERVACEERSHFMDMIVDSHFITGETKNQRISNDANGTVNAVPLYYGSRILEGACIALVVATGNRVVLRQLINQGRWPPKTDLSEIIQRIESDRMTKNMDMQALISSIPFSS